MVVAALVDGNYAAADADSNGDVLDAGLDD